MSALGDQLKAFRTRHGWSLRTMSRKLNSIASYSHLSLIEAGHMPHPETQVRLKRALGIPLTIRGTDTLYHVKDVIMLDRSIPLEARHRLCEMMSIAYATCIYAD